MGLMVEFIIINVIKKPYLAGLLNRGGLVIPVSLASQMLM